VEWWVQPNDYISFTFGFIILELYQYNITCIITIIDYYCMSHIIITCNYEYYH
jgi:hypothetical protein